MRSADTSVALCVSVMKRFGENKNTKIGIAPTAKSDNREKKGTVNLNYKSIKKCQNYMFVRVMSLHI